MIMDYAGIRRSGITIVEIFMFVAIIISQIAFLLGLLHLLWGALEDSQYLYRDIDLFFTTGGLFMLNAAFLCLAKLTFCVKKQEDALPRT